MPRSVVLSNGSMHVGINRSGQVHDLYFPHVGLENHISEYSRHRLGVLVDGTFSWVHRSDWDIRSRYEKDTALSNITMSNKHLGITITARGAVYNELPIFARAFTVVNDNHSQSRQCKIFFCQEFRMGNSTYGDTAYYDPRTQGIIHYKGDRAVVVNARHNEHYFKEFTTGLYQIEGKEGSFRAAEQNALNNNPIEHGSVDSVIAFEFTLGSEPEHLDYWIAAGRSIDQATKHNRVAARRGVDRIIASTGSYHRVDLQKNKELIEFFPKPISKTIETSLTVLKAHADHTGGIIASSDSSILNQGRDTYSYVWPRDAGVSAIALDQTGSHHTAKQFYAYAARIQDYEGYVLHKFRPDGLLGSSWEPWLHNGKFQIPLQEDETAIVVIGMLEHFKLTSDTEFLENSFNTYILHAAEFMTHYRNPQTGLPYASYDLWEEKLGVHSFTASIVYGALMAAAEVARLLGKENFEEKWRSAAQEVQQGINTHLWSDEFGYVKSVRDDHAKSHYSDCDVTIDVSSWYGVWRYGVDDPRSERMQRATKIMHRALSVANIGGIARNENDYYYRASQELPSNPWILTTLWLAQYYIAIDELDEAEKLLHWVSQRGLESGVLPEQVHPNTGDLLGATPLAWSHAEYLITARELKIKREV